MSSTPSSGRRRGHSSRKSQSSTPASQQNSQATPRGSRANAGSVGNVPSSSPLFFHTSSPAKSTPTQRGTLTQQGSQRSQGPQVPSSPRHGKRASQSGNGLLPSSPRQASSVSNGDREGTPKASRQPNMGKQDNKLVGIILISSRVKPSPLRRLVFTAAASQ